MTRRDCERFWRSLLAGVAGGNNSDWFYRESSTLEMEMIERDVITPKKVRCIRKEWFRILEMTRSRRALRFLFWTLLGLVCYMTIKSPSTSTVLRCEAQAVLYPSCYLAAVVDLDIIQLKP